MLQGQIKDSELDKLLYNVLNSNHDLKIPSGLSEKTIRKLKKKDVTGFYKDWLAFEARVDAAALAIFDMYMASRERINKVRITELQTGRSIITKDGCPSAFMDRKQSKKA